MKTDEEKGDYKIEAEEALEMLGAGYEQPAAIIDPSRTVRALHGGGLVEYRVWGWVKTSARFRAHIKILRGAKHDIWHYLALGVNENGECRETIKQICEGTGYSHTEVINTLRELDEMGYLSVQKNSKGNIYTPEFVARGDKKPTENAVKKVDSTPAYRVESTPPIEKTPAIPLRVKRVNKRERPKTTPDFSAMTVEEAYRLPTIRMYRKATGFFPGQLSWEFVHNFITEFNVTEENMKLAATEWQLRGFKSENVKGILEWARDGIPQNSKNQKGYKSKERPVITNEPAAFEAIRQYEAMINGNQK